MSRKPVQNILEEEEVVKVENINYRKKGNQDYVMKSEKDCKNMHQVVHKSLELKGIKTTQLFLELLGVLGEEEKNHPLIQQYRNKHLKLLQEVNEEKKIDFCPDDRVAKVGEKGAAIVWIKPDGTITEYSRDNYENLVPGAMSYYVFAEKELVEVKPQIQIVTDESSPSGSSSGSGSSQVLTNPEQGASSQENETCYGLDGGLFSFSDI